MRGDFDFLILLVSHLG